VDGVVLTGLGQRKLMGLTLEPECAVAQPVRPRRKHLSRTAGGQLTLFVAVDVIVGFHPVPPQTSTDLDHDGGLISLPDAPLSSTRCHERTITETG
jgi:hypothetical protein